MINFDLRTSYFCVVFLSILLSICFPLHQEFWFAFSSISIVKSSKSAHKWFRSANLPWSSTLFELHLTLCFFLAIGVLQYFSDEPFLWSYSLYSGRSLRSASLCIPQFCPPSSSQLLKLHFTSFQLQPQPPSETLWSPCSASWLKYFQRSTILMQLFASYGSGNWWKGQNMKERRSSCTLAHIPVCRHEMNTLM